MKTNELRINNIVLSRGAQSVIKSIDENHVGYSKRETVTEKKVPLKLIQPIPLTEEWLVNLGFVSDNHKHHETFFIDISTDERPEIKTSIDIHVMNNYGVAYITDNEMDIDINTCFMRKIKYVHQLQNLYFALTGKELTLKTKQ